MPSGLSYQSDLMREPWERTVFGLDEILHWFPPNIHRFSVRCEGKIALSDGLSNGKSRLAYPEGRRSHLLPALYRVLERVDG